VRVWTFPGNTSDQVLVRSVRDDLSSWNPNRVILALDRGFASAKNRRYLQRGGGHYIVGEKLRGDSKEVAIALARQGRYQTVADNLAIKEVRVDNGSTRDRFVICCNPEAAKRDEAVRDQIVVRLADRIAGSDDLAEAKRAELAGRLKTKAAVARRRNKVDARCPDRAAPPVGDPGEAKATMRLPGSCPHRPLSKRSQPPRFPFGHANALSTTLSPAEHQGVRNS